MELLKTKIIRSFVKEYTDSLFYCFIACLSADRLLPLAFKTAIGTTKKLNNEIVKKLNYESNRLSIFTK